MNSRQTIEQMGSLVVFHILIVQSSKSNSDSVWKLLSQSVSIRMVQLFVRCVCTFVFEVFLLWEPYWKFTPWSDVLEVTRCFWNVGVLLWLTIQNCSNVLLPVSSTSSIKWDRYSHRTLRCQSHSATRVHETRVKCSIRIFTYKFYAACLKQSDKNVQIYNISACIRYRCAITAGRR